MSRRRISIILFLLLALNGFFLDAISAQEKKPDRKKPLQVFVLVGQSNMQGHADVRTLSQIKKDEATRSIYEDLVQSDGTPRTFSNVAISYLSSKGETTGQLTAGFGAGKNKIGPELAFGYYMQKHLGEPILIIKVAWGGKSLNTDFRPPSAGPYEFNENQLENLKRQKKSVKQAESDKAKATGHFYRETVKQVKSVLGDIQRVYPEYDSRTGYELAGMVWFQGWNDMVDRGTYPDRGGKEGYQEYSRLLVKFIDDIRKDLSAPEMPFVIGVLGVGGPVSEYLPDQKRYEKIHQNFRDAMAAPAKEKKFAGNVQAVLTEKYWDLNLRDLRARDGKIRNQINQLVKNGELEKKNQRAAIDEARKKEFNPDELDSLLNGASNFEFHYLGSAKIMTQIGKGFADAMIEMKKRR